MTSALNTLTIAKGARVATVVIFMALIRCIAEVFRLQYYAAAPLSLAQVQPFIIGALVAAVALLAMNLLAFYNRYRAVVVLAALTVVALLVVKTALMA